MSALAAQFHKVGSLNDVISTLKRNTTGIKILSKEDDLEALFKYTTQVISEYDTKTTEMMEWIDERGNKQVKLQYDSYI